MFSNLQSGLLVALTAVLAAGSPAARERAPGVREFAGRLEIIVEDAPDLSQARTLYFLRDEAGTRYRLDFATRPSAHLRTGSRVTLDGTLDGQTIGDLSERVGSAFDEYQFAEEKFLRLLLEKATQ